MNDNKIIAEFMGVERTYNPSTKKVLSYAVNDDVQCLPHELQYHTEWNWLMPVIIKMADIREDTHYKLYKTIDEAYEEVVEFIKTYNDESYFLCGSCGERCSEYTYSEDRDIDECNECKASNNDTI